MLSLVMMFYTLAIYEFPGQKAPKFSDVSETSCTLSKMVTPHTQ